MIREGPLSLCRICIEDFVLAGLATTPSMYICKKVHYSLLACLSV